MITQPSIPRLLLSIREELVDKVLPCIEDPTVVVNVEMMTAVLSALSIRVEHEIEWMRQECDAIETAAVELEPSLGDESLAEALTAYREHRAATLALSDVAAEYQHASELLSRLSEAAYASGDADAIAGVQELFDARLATEQAAIGTFIAVGRD